MISLAHAMGTTAPAGGAGASGFGPFIPLILIFVIFYFLLIRPQQKKQKEHREMVDNLKKGDRIITSGGIYGTVASLDDTTISLEVSDGIRIKINRGNVAGLPSGKGKAAPVKKDKKEKKEADKKK